MVNNVQHNFHYLDGFHEVQADQFTVTHITRNHNSRVNVLYNV